MSSKGEINRHRERSREHSFERHTHRASRTDNDGRTKHHSPPSKHRSTSRGLKHKKEKKSKKTKKKKRHSSSSSSSSDSDEEELKLLQRLEAERLRIKEEKQKQKEQMKANETPEEKRHHTHTSTILSTVLALLLMKTDATKPKLYSHKIKST